MKLYLRAKQLYLTGRYLAALLVLKKSFPHWAYLTLTRKCNLLCPYCYVSDPDAAELSAADTVRAVDQLHRLGTRWVSFTGGEPTLNKTALLAGIRQASLKKRMFTQLPTNGTLLTREYLAALGAAGLDLLDISLDSLQQHRSKKGLLDRNSSLIQEILAAQKKYGFILKANFVLNKQNLSEVAEVLEFCHRNRILLSLRMVFPSPGKKGVHSTADSGFLTTADLPGLKKVLALILAKKRSGYALTEPLSYYLLWEKYVAESGCQWRCDAGENCLGIDSDGMVRICNSLPADEGRTSLHFTQLNNNYPALLRQQAAEIKQTCQSRCLAAAYYCSQEYRRHPLTFLRDSFFYRIFTPFPSAFGGHLSPTARGKAS